MVLKNKFDWHTIIFVPIFFSLHGIYKGIITSNDLHLGDRGLILPLIFFYGILTILLITINTLKTKKMIVNRQFTGFLIIAILYPLIIALIGYVETGEIIVGLRLVQFLSLFLGVSIFYYLFIVKKKNFSNFFKSLFWLLLVTIALHYISSALEIGLSRSLLSISPNIFFFGIYQSRVYYPYLFITIFFFTLLFVKSSLLKTIAIFIVGFYVFSLQVRGALISYVAYLTIYILVFSKYRLLYLLGLITSLLIFRVSNFSLQQYDLGRFGDVQKFSSFNGRTEIWEKDLRLETVNRFLFGDLFYDVDGISSHNQYINFYVYGGVILVGIFLFLAVYFTKELIIRQFKMEKKKVFSIFVFLIPALIDLNLNVPLNNINSGIIYSFMWSAVLYYLNNVEVYSEKAKI